MSTSGLKVAPHSPASKQTPCNNLGKYYQYTNPSHAHNEKYMQAAAMLAVQELALQKRRPNIMAFSPQKPPNLIISLKSRCLSM
uniref:Uncharacterized protein n=1 Tax=Strigops habroptila TaxID=2489341 RepID=A0A672TIN4_STRHB